MVIFFLKNQKIALNKGFAPDSRLHHEMMELQHLAQLATQSRHFSNKKNFNFQAPSFSKISVVCLFIYDVSESRNDQQNRLFRFLKDQLLFFLTRSTLFRSQSLLRIDFSTITGRKQKEPKNVTGRVCLFFRHDCRILKLRILVICCRTKSVLNSKSLVYFNASSLRSLWRRH